MAQTGMAHAIYPVHTPLDGDTCPGKAINDGLASNRHEQDLGLRRRAVLEGDPDAFDSALHMSHRPAQQRRDPTPLERTVDRRRQREEQHVPQAARETAVHTIPIGCKQRTVVSVGSQLSENATKRTGDVEALGLLEA